MAEQCEAARSLRVLVIDDDETARYAIRSFAAVVTSAVDEALKRDGK